MQILDEKSLNELQRKITKCWKDFNPRSLQWMSSSGK